jgi:hypothetical protein
MEMTYGAVMNEVGRRLLPLHMISILYIRVYLLTTVGNDIVWKAVFTVAKDWCIRKEAFVVGASEEDGGWRPDEYRQENKG